MAVTTRNSQPVSIHRFTTSEPQHLDESSTDRLAALGQPLAPEFLQSQIPPHLACANQQLPNGRGRRNSNPLTFNCKLSSGIGGNLSILGKQTQGSASVDLSRRTGIDSVLRHAASWLSLISPRYNTVRCTVFPELISRFSTTLKYRWSLPSFFRFVRRRTHPAQNHRNVFRKTGGRSSPQPFSKGRRLRTQLLTLLKP